MSKKVSGAISKICDVVFWLIMFVCLLSSFVVFSADGRRGGAYRLFGVVQSGSMEASGMYKGDVVLVDKADVYEVGDIIVFYRAPYSYDKYAKDLNFSGVSIWVHQIVDVDEDGKGRRTYLTKGTSNSVDDGYYVPEDFVLGAGLKMPDFFSDLVIFLTSALGILLCIVLPSGILFLLFTVDFCKTVLEDVGADEEAELAAAGRNKVAPVAYAPSKTEKRYQKRLKGRVVTPIPPQPPKSPQYYWYQYPNYYENTQTGYTGNAADPSQGANGYGYNNYNSYNGYGGYQSNYQTNNQNGYYGYGGYPQGQAQTQTTRKTGKKK